MAVWVYHAGELEPAGSWEGAAAAGGACVQTTPLPVRIRTVVYMEVSYRHPSFIWKYLTGEGRVCTPWGACCAAIIIIITQGTRQLSLAGCAVRHHTPVYDTHSAYTSHICGVSQGGSLRCALT